MRATSLGSLPGSDMAAALRLLLDEGTEVLAVPELPARGPESQMIGRALGLGALPVETRIGRWHLADHRGREQRRARAQWRSDLDDLEEACQGYEGNVKIALCGPWTLATLLELPRGGRVLGDGGALRELVESLAFGLDELLAEMRRRMPAVEWWLQIDEPMLDQVMTGGVATISGLQRHRGVAPSEIADALGSLGAPADLVALHVCGAPQVDLLGHLELQALSVQISALTGSHCEALAGWFESGHHVWWGAVRTDQPDRLAPIDSEVHALLECLRRIGVDHEWHVNDLVTPACGLAAWSPSAARAALRQTGRIAQIAAEELAAG